MSSMPPQAGGTGSDDPRSEGAAPAPSQSASKPYLYFLLPPLVALAALASGLGGGFVLDDQQAIVGNPAVNGDLPASAVWTRTFWGQPLDHPPLSWRPLTSLLFRLEAALVGLDPLPFHLTSLALYLLLLPLAQRLARLWLSPRAALLAVLLFAVMPIHVENVSSLVGRADTLALLLSLASLLCLGPWIGPGPPVENAESGGRGGEPQTASTIFRISLAILFYVAAILCKESAALLPLPVAALALWQGRGSFLRRVLPAGVLGLAGCATLGLRLWIIPATFRGYAIPDDVLAPGAPIWERAALSLGLVPRYLLLVLAPVDLCTGRKYAMVARPEGWQWLYSVAGAVLLALLVWRSVGDLRARRPPFLLCAFLCWLVFSSLFFPMPEVMADRFMLGPSLFLALAPAAALDRLLARRPHWLTMLLVVVGLQAAACAYYARTWRSTLALLSHAVTACPSSVHNHFRLADVLSEAGRPEEALWHYAVASVGRSRFPAPWSHPCLDLEIDLPASKRLLYIHCLLEVDRLPPAWRLAMERFLRGRGRFREVEVLRRLPP